MEFRQGLQGKFDSVISVGPMFLLGVWPGPMVGKSDLQGNFFYFHVLVARQGHGSSGVQ
jgi:hypothetical protein